MYYSYAMGIGKNIYTLKRQGFKIKKYKSDYKVVFQETKEKIWEDFIADNLQLGYWNKYITKDKVIFLFHMQDGIHRYEVTDFENEEVLLQCEALCNRKFGSIKNILLSNKFYKKILNKS